MDKIYLKCAHGLLPEMYPDLFFHVGMMVIHEWMLVCVARKINYFMKKLIMRLDILSHKVGHNVIVLVLPTMLVIDQKRFLMSLRTKASRASSS